MYYLNGTSFYRYDTITDTWQQLANCPYAPYNDVCMRYDSTRGYYGRVVDPTKLPCITVPVNTLGMQPTGNSFYAAGLDKGVFNGKTITIISGTGCGQTATIGSVDAPVIFEFEMHDTTGNTSSNASVFDMSAQPPHYTQWTTNQWRDYKVRFFANGMQMRKILYNSSNSLTFSDINYYGVNPWINCPTSGLYTDRRLHYRSIQIYSQYNLVYCSRHFIPFCNK